MIQKSVKLSGFTGINNVSRPEQLSNSELTTAFNFDLTNAKSLRRRLGRRSVYQGACHSLFSDGDYLYFRDSNSLIRFDPNNDATVTLRSDIVASNRMSYLLDTAKIYYSDGVVTGIIEGGSDRSWGIPAPSQPEIADTVGDLPAGSYQLALTYARANGQESGASTPSLIRNISGGINVTSIPQSSDSGVAFIVIYLTPRDAKTLYRVGVLRHGTTSVVIRGGQIGNGVPLSTLNLNSPPASQLMDLYNGRIYMAAGDVLWYTNPYQYEHVDYRFNYMEFDGRITMVKAIERGIWISSGGLAHFLGGDDPMSEQAPLGIRASYAYPAVEGTACVTDGKIFGRGEIVGQVAIWTSKNGICVGLSDGTLLNVTENRFKPQDAATGVATMVRNGDSVQYLAAIDVGPNGGIVRLPQFRT